MRLTKIKNWSWLALLVMVASLLLGSPAIAQTPQTFDKLTFPPLAQVQIPPYERYKLPNGITVYLMEDHRLPSVKGSAILGISSVLEPTDKTGLAEITGELLRSGGTKQHTPNELNEILENRAASIESSIGIDSGNVSFHSLSQDFEDVFKLFVQVIRDPRFDQEQFDLLKTQFRGKLARRNDNPSEIAGREFKKLIYGADSPYARTAEYTTLDKIAPEDPRQFYSQLEPNQIILGIVGDFDTAKVKELIKQSLENWTSQQTTNPKIKSSKKVNLSQAKTGGIYTVNQSQLNQSNVLLGQLGGTVDSPDYPSLTVLNGVLNGFGGRLFNNIRSKQGLAYSVYGLWRANYNYPGLFIAGGQTRSMETAAFIKAIDSEIERIRKSPVTPDELALAKDSILNSFVFNFSNPAAILSRLMTYEYFNYPSDFIFRYQKAVNNVTAADVQRVAQKYLKPEEMVTLVVGNIKDIDSSLVGLGKKLEPINIVN
jgi:zinc protease